MFIIFPPQKGTYKSSRTPAPSRSPSVSSHAVTTALLPVPLYGNVKSQKIKKKSLWIFPRGGRLVTGNVERGSQGDVLAVGGGTPTALSAPFGGLDAMGQGVIPAPGGRGLSWGSLCQRAAPKGHVQFILVSQVLSLEPWKRWMSLPGWQVHVVPSQAPHSPQGCPGGSHPSPRRFVTAPGLQEEGSLPQPTPALGEPKRA